jgi:uncharacterized membrane protein
MTNFPLGLITLVVVSILIYFGVAHRVLDKLRLSDRAALAIILAIIAGSFVDIPISSRITINLGGLAICLPPFPSTFRQLILFSQYGFN